MTTEVEIIADTISPAGKRITTFMLTYPRYIHPELLTHRCFSRNASSSRAVPVSKLLRQVIYDPVVPIHFGANQRGMSAAKELTGWRKWLARKLWLGARWPAVGFVWTLSKLGLHKQVSNRILEPWLYIQVVLTSTEFDNFYALRCDAEHAHPDIYKLAELMLSAHNTSLPIESSLHLPFVSAEERGLWLYSEGQLFKFSVARCCRVSYLNLDKTKPEPIKDLKLYNELLTNGHLSPFEHQAVALENPQQSSGNFVGWLQYRKTLVEDQRKSFTRLKKRV